MNGYVFTWSRATATLRFLGAASLLGACGGNTPANAVDAGQDLSLASDMTPSGCTKDTDCKGNRICDHGICVGQTPPDLATVDLFESQMDLATTQDMTCVPMPSPCPKADGTGCPTNCGGGLGVGGVCDQNAMCTPCGRQDEECCVNNQCLNGLTCVKENQNSWGIFTRCQDAQCGTKGHECCYGCGNVIGCRFCINNLNCQNGVCN
jgi:hypothetical protein